MKLFQKLKQRRSEADAYYVECVHERYKWEQYGFNEVVHGTPITDLYGSATDDYIQAVETGRIRGERFLRDNIARRAQEQRWAELRNGGSRSEDSHLSAHESETK